MSNTAFRKCCPRLRFDWSAGRLGQQRPDCCLSRTRERKQFGLGLGRLIFRTRYKAVFVTLFFTANLASAQQSLVDNSTALAPPVLGSASQPYTLAARGANRRVFQAVNFVTNATGRVASRKVSYTELTTGLSRYLNGQWSDCDPGLVITAAGAQGTNTHHSLALLGNLNTLGAVSVTTPDNKQFVSNLLGLRYADASGKSVIIAQVTNSLGQLLPSRNEALYPDAFSGSGIHADALYLNSLDGVEQLVVLRTKLPSPDTLGLDPDTTVLQVITEFLDPPAPGVYPITADSGYDEYLDFGVMHMRRGEAFAIGFQTNRVAVEKHWFSADNRQFLAEQVPLSAVRPLLEPLPPPDPVPETAGRAPNRSSTRQLAKASPLPLRRQTRSAASPFRIAMSRPESKGFALDYTLVTTQTNAVFQSDTTYVITNAVTLSGSNVWEPGAVLRFGTNGSLTVAPNSQIKWLGTAYRPVLMTSLDDSSVGEYIAGTNPPRTYGTALDLTGLTNVNFGNLRISFAQKAIVLSAASVTITNAQFASCSNAISTGGSTVHLRNVLFAQTLKDIVAQGGDSVTVENGTSSTTGTFITAPTGPSASVAMTNCILVNVTNNTAGSVTLTGSFNGFYASTAFGNNQVSASIYPFQTIGGGSCYLTNDCPFHNAGTTNIDPGLLGQLALKTTYPPILPVTNVTYVANANLTLFPQAGRDTGQANVDLGWHYDPIDWAFSWVHITNATLTVMPGTVLSFYASAYGGGFQLDGGGQLLCQGTPQHLAMFVDGAAVQELATNSWCARNNYAYIIASFSSGPSAYINCRFADFSSPAQDAYIISQGGPNCLPIVFQDCRFHGGYTYNEYTSIEFTNCLMERVSIDHEPSDTYVPVVRNCTFFGGSFCLFPYPGTNSIAFDNLFDETSLDCGYVGTTGGFNASITNFDHPGFATDIILLSAPIYQSGPLGNWYVPTNSALINADTSTTANQVGLYHYTMYTNLVGGYQIKETNSWLDISFHYVATDANGNPIDSNGDGIADYLSDSNGNGLVDSGEIGWTTVGDLGLKVLITRPANSSIIP